MIRWGYLGMWLIATLAATLVAWWAVAAVGDEVSDEPLVPRVTTSTVAAFPSNTTLATEDPVPGASSAPTTAPVATTTIEEPASPSTTAAAWQLQTVNSGGGKVIVAYRPGEVRLQSATPNPGFEMEIEDEGPPEVEVRFEGEEVSYRVEARWEHGELAVDVDESGEGSGEDHPDGSGGDDSGEG